MTELYRFELRFLEEWFNQSKRKPLVIRGARQVGKSTIVKMFAREQGLDLLTLDFEKTTDDLTLFESHDPATIIELLQAKFGKKIVKDKTLLFLDEIQKAPEVLISLRYFYEEMPELTIICAGSLLDLALTEINFSIPVGRISYMYLGPMSFQSFLYALGNKPLVEFLQNYKLTTVVPLAIHKQLLELLKIYFLVGGLPESVSRYIETRDLLDTAEIKHSLLSAYQDDFAKYATPAQQERMRRIFNMVPRILGEKFKYSNISKDEKSTVIKEALEKLVLARVVTKACATAANGLPLGAEEKIDFYKTYFLDVGLVCTILDLNYKTFAVEQDIALVNSGKIAEQFISQHLQYLNKWYEDTPLYYWARDKKSASAEVDFLIAQNAKIVPIEVKAGSSGSLKSLHYFMKEKKVNLGVRFSGQLPSITNENAVLSSGENIEYKLLSLPLYMIEELSNLLEDVT